MSSPFSCMRFPDKVEIELETIPDWLPDKTAESNWKSNWEHIL